MKKFRTIRNLVLIFLLAIFGIGVISTFFATPETEKTYTITYKVVAQGYVVDIPENAFVKGRNYPTTYTEGETVVLDDPVQEYWYDAYNQYEFRGWYLDEACTIPFDGETVANSNQDVTVYAKTKWYLWSPTV